MKKEELCEAKLPFFIYFFSLKQPVFRVFFLLFFEEKQKKKARVAFYFCEAKIKMLL